MDKYKKAMKRAAKVAQMKRSLARIKNLRKVKSYGKHISDNVVARQGFNTSLEEASHKVKSRLEHEERNKKRRKKEQEERDKRSRMSYEGPHNKK
jgi:hypothetical protein